MMQVCSAVSIHHVHQVDFPPWQSMAKALVSVIVYMSSFLALNDPYSTNALVQKR